MIYQNNSNEYILSTNPMKLEFKPFINIGILASGKGTNFENLINLINEDKLDFKVALLVTNNPNADVIKKAIKLNIPYKIIDHRDFNTREEFDKSIVNNFVQYQVEGIVMAGWMRIVTKILIDAYPNRLVNIHPSLLPSFKGLDAVGQAIKAKVKLTGCSVHLVTVNVDDGPILVQAATSIKKNENRNELLKRIQILEHMILPTGIQIAASHWRKDINTMDSML